MVIPTFHMRPQPNVVFFGVIFNHGCPSMVVTYIRSTNEHVPTTIVGHSTRGDGFFHMRQFLTLHMHSLKIGYRKRGIKFLMMSCALP